MRRRDLLHKCLLGAGGVVAAPMLNLGRCRLHAGTPRQYSTRAIDAVIRSTVVDMLGLLTLDWPRLFRWHADPNTFTDNDLALLRQSGINVFHPAVDLNRTNAFTETTAWLNRWNGFLEARSAEFIRVSCCSDFAAAKDSGKIGILLGMQNSDHFRSPEDVRAFYDLGQRVSQLTYNGQNRIGHGCTDRHDLGLSPFGISIIDAMNDAKMVIDVSHAGERTALEAFEASAHPVLISHSNCKSLVHHPRCVSDAVIRAMARKGGVLGITAIRTFAGERSQVTIEDVLDHFDYVARLVGVEHVGIGSDMDLEGRASYDIRGLNHPKRVFDLADGLVRRRYSDDAIDKILGGNFSRAISAIC